MKQLLFLLAALFAVHTRSLAQTKPPEKKVEQIQRLIRSEKLEEADRKLDKLMADYPEWGEGWDLLVALRVSEYEEALKKDRGMGFTLTTKDKDGKVVQNDSLTRLLADMLSKNKPSQIAMRKMLYTCRKATLCSHDCYNSSIYLRMKTIDPDVDSIVDEEAMRLYNEAEEKFGAREYGSAAKLYQKALDIQPDFYKAALYLGDCFYAMENYGDAISSFKEARDRFPDLLEPRKFLTDAYSRADLSEKAVSEAFATMLVYPDYTMSEKLDNALEETGKRFKVRWMPRGVFPNRPPDSPGVVRLEYEDPHPLEAQGCWKGYVEAGRRVRKYADYQGILRSNSVTPKRYLEVYSWEEMLRANPDDPALAEARRMQEKGYLDCYVLVTLFHRDIYDQYHDFVTRNGDKVRRYQAEFTK